MTEATIVGRAQDGDLESFETLVRRYQDPMFRLAYRMLRDRGDAESVVQDAMTLVWRRLPSLNNAVTFRAWIYQIATRQCLTVLRTRARERTDVLPEDELEASQRTSADRSTHDSADPAGAAVLAASQRSLDHAVAHLGEQQRACWVMRELHQLSYTEIAHATGLSVSTVRGCLARARQNLGKEMATWK